MQIKGSASRLGWVVGQAGKAADRRTVPFGTTPDHWPGWERPRTCISAQTPQQKQKVLIAFALTLEWVSTPDPLRT
jgi:hypothetical protein